MVKQEMGSGEPEESQENLNQNDESQKVSRRGFLKAAAGAFIGSSMLGKASETFAEDAPEKSKGTEELQKDKDFLGDKLVEISEGGVVNKKNGNMVIHVGNGHYYEIKSADSNKLLMAKEIRHFREDLEDPDNRSFKIIEENKDKVKSPGDKAYYKNLYDKLMERKKQRDKIIKDYLTQKIKEIGSEMQVDDLPDELKKFEDDREERLMRALKKSIEKRK